MLRSIGISRQVFVRGVMLGVGIGGFFDGVVFHQVLQWHHLLSNVEPVNTLAGLEVNTLADGLFHLFALISTVIGLSLLWNDSRKPHGYWSSQLLFGLILVGWGGFNLIEGLVNHHLLSIHHVRPGPDQFWYDLAFLFWGAAMLALGLMLARVAHDRSTEPRE